MTYSYSISKTEGVSYGVAQVHVVDEFGTVQGGAVFTKNAVSDPLSGSGTIARNPAYRYRVRAVKFNWDNSLNVQQAFYIEPNPDYYADFRIPANTSSVPFKVRFYQGGDLLTELTVQPGTGAQTVHLSSGVVEGELITVVYSYGGYEMSPGGTLTFVPDKEYENGGGGMPVNDVEPPDPYQALPPRNNVGITPQNEPTTPPTPETPQSAPTPVTAPTPQTPVAAPTGGVMGIPFGSPSGTSGVTKQDLETATNATVTAMSTADSNRQASDDATLAAINKTNTALGDIGTANTAGMNALREEMVSGSNKQLAAVGTSTAEITALRDDVKAGNSTLARIAGALDTLKSQKETPTSEVLAQKVNEIMSIATDAGATTQAAANVHPTTGTVREDSSDAGEIMPTITLPGHPSTGEVTISLNPLQNANVKIVANLLRALIGWSVLVWLISWTYMQIPVWFNKALQGGSGITIWKSLSGTATPLVGFVVFVTVMVLVGTTTALLTAPTLMWAAAEPYMMGAAGSALVDLRDVIDTYAGSKADAILSILDACCPTGLCVTAFFNFVGLKIAGEAIIAGLLGIQKVLASG